MQKNLTLVITIIWTIFTVIQILHTHKKKSMFDRQTDLWPAVPRAPPSGSGTEVKCDFYSKYYLLFVCLFLFFLSPWHKFMFYFVSFMSFHILFHYTQIEALTPALLHTVQKVWAAPYCFCLISSTLCVTSVFHNVLPANVIKQMSLQRGGCARQLPSR